MTEHVTLKPAATVPTEDAVVTVMPSVVGAHVGILYRIDRAGSRRHLHLAFHFDLRDEPGAPGDAHWVVPHLDEIALADLGQSAWLIARSHENGRVPYAFRKSSARFESGGTLTLNQSLGLTCSTFVSLVFAHAGIPLLEEGTWDLARSAERRLEDTAAQLRLVGYLRRTPDAQEHADRVAAEIGCTRVRAEEVAAASGMTGHPIPFARAEPEGRRVLEAIQATSS